MAAGSESQTKLPTAFERYDKRQDSELAVIGKLVVLCQIALVQDVFVHAYFRDFPYPVDSKAFDFT